MYLNSTIKCCVYYMVFMAVLFMTGCKRTSHYTFEDATRTQLHSVAIWTKITSLKTNQPPPEKLSEFVDWLKEICCSDGDDITGKRDRIDFANKTITDSWDNPIIVVFKDGEYIGLGSAGPDGKWRNNSGDDIFVPRSK